MIFWIFGEQMAGKTTLGKFMAKRMNGILLDGDAMRNSISKDLGFSDEDRFENNLRIARLAKELESQGFVVIVATILPDIEGLRKEVLHITRCKFISL